MGDVRTTHPEPGKSIIKASKTPDNIKKLLKDVIDLPKEAETELKTKKEFQNKILELKRELRISKSAQPKPIADEKALERSRAKGFKEAEISFKKVFQELQNEYNKTVKKVTDIGKIIGQKIPKFNGTPIFKPTPIQPNPQIQRTVAPISTQSVPDKYPINEESGNNQYIGICAKKIYSFLYNHPERSFTKHHIGAFTGYSHKSGGFSNAISQLNSNGLIIKSGNSLQVKEMDSEIAGEYDFSKESIMKNLGVCPKKIYQLLLDNPYQEYSREEIGELTGYSHGSGGFSNAISKLNSLGLVEKDNSHLKLNQELLET